MLSTDTIATDTSNFDSYFNYPGPPTRWICFVFIVLFGITGVLHISETIYYRMWWLLPTVDLAAFGEIAGWGARLGSSYHPNMRAPYLTQDITIVLAPTLYIATIFIMFSRMTEAMGPQYSRLTPRRYSRIFLTCDIFSLLIQGNGGGMAASADTPAKVKIGSAIMLTGIAFQLPSIAVFIGLSIEFYVRFCRNIPFDMNYSRSRDATFPVRHNWNKKVKTFTIGLAIIMFCIYIRSVYRTIEFANGWNGRIIRNEALFNVLDGAMPVISLFTLNFAHPRLLLPGSSASKPRPVIPLEDTQASGKEDCW